MSVSVFLGAGASKAFGYPLTAELLPRLLLRLDQGKLFQLTNSDEDNDADRAWFAERLFRFLPGLRDGWDSAKQPAEKRQKLGVTVTDLMTLVDRSIGQAEARAGMPPEDLTRFRQLLDRGIYEALVRDSEAGKGFARDQLDAFLRWLTGLSAGATLITTNYDTLVDCRLFKWFSKRFTQANRELGDKIDFGFSWRTINRGDLIPRPKDPRFRLFKLHGSLNWLRCSLCGQVYLNTKGPIGTQSFARKLHQWNTCHCNNWARLGLHLVTPSLIRQIQDAHLLGIWQAAMEVLRKADEWVLIGYSFPPEDVAIRALFLRAWDGRIKKPKVTVVQKGDETAERTYRAFFPRESLKYHNDGLEAFLETTNSNSRRS